MQLTLRTDYSLRILIYLTFLDKDETATINEIVNQYEISRGHVMKVVYHLSKKGYLTSIRGKGGGVKLSRPATDINIGQVVRDMEANFFVAECLNPESTSCNIKKDCTLIPVLYEAKNKFLEVFDKYSLQDVVKNKSSWTSISFINN